VNYADNKLKPEWSMFSAQIDKYVVKDVENHEDLHGTLAILRFDRWPIYTEEKVDKTHARLQKDQEEPP